MASRSTSSRIDALQGARGLAALLVVVNHAIWQLGDRIGFTKKTIDYSGVLGHFGVAMFFVISGFIMVFTSRSEFAKPGAPQSFMIRRILRIVPIYWLLSMVEFASDNRHGLKLDSIPYLLCSLFFIPYRNISGSMSPIFGVGWTLNYEMLFYVIFALWLARSRRVATVGVCLSVLALMGAALLLPGVSLPAPVLDIARYWTDPIMLYFVFGLIIASIRLYLDERSISIRAPLQLALGTCLAITLAYLYLASLNIPGPYARVITATAVILVVGIAALGQPASFAHLAGEKTASKVAHFLGDSSFSIYLIHMYLIGWLLHLARPGMGFWASTGFVIVATAFAIVGGRLMFRYVETPIGAVLKRGLPRRQPPVGEPVKAV